MDADGIRESSLFQSDLGSDGSYQITLASKNLLSALGEPAKFIDKADLVRGICGWTVNKTQDEDCFN